MAADIQHVIVLMLENRSFDSMLGMLYPNDPDFKGLTGQESNHFAGVPIPVWNDEGITPDAAYIPTPDPGESFVDMNTQLFGGLRTQDSPPMSGFAFNYMSQPASKEGPHDPRATKLRQSGIATI